MKFSFSQVTKLRIGRAVLVNKFALALGVLQDLQSCAPTIPLYL